MRVRPTRRLEMSQRIKSGEEGFSLIQAIIVVAVAAILTGAAAVSIQGSRQGMRLSNSARKLAGYLEAARIDSVRRRAQVGNESSIQIIDNNTYQVTMGFGGSNVLTSRDFDLDDSVVFVTNPMTLRFNWRGRPLTGMESTFDLQNSSGFTRVDVTGSGDVTVGSEIVQDDSIPTVTLNTNVSGDVMPDQPNPDSSPTPTPSP